METMTGKTKKIPHWALSYAPLFAKDFGIVIAKGGSNPCRHNELQCSIKPDLSCSCVLSKVIKRFRKEKYLCTQFLTCEAECIAKKPHFMTKKCHDNCINIKEKT